MRGIVVSPIFINAVKECRQTIIIPLRERIEFMIMTTGTLERQRQHGGPKGVNAVGHIFCAPFLFDAAAFVRLPMEPIEGGR